LYVPWLLNPPLTALAAIFTVTLMTSLHGCGGDAPEFDKTALHTPETLVQEFVLRYRRLPAQVSAEAKAQAARLEKVQAALPDVDAESAKSARSEA
jgi:hypothetical protein